MSRDDPTTAEWLRTALDRVCVGSGRLFWHHTRRSVAAGRRLWARCAAWLGESSGLAWGCRAAALGVAGLVAGRVALALGASIARRVDSARWLVYPAAAVWLIAAYRAGHPDWKPKRPTPAPAAPDEQPEPGDEPDDDSGTADRAAPGPPLPTRDQLAATLHRIGTPHCHTAALAEALGIPTDRAREALAAAGIPTDTVRMKGRGSSTGVRAADFPPLPRDGEGSPVGVVAAGQNANNDNNNNAAADFECVADPDRPGFTRVVYRTARRA